MMKKNIKNFFKMILIFTLSTIIIYYFLSFLKLYSWCVENQILLSVDKGFSDEHINNLLEYKIDYLAMSIREYESGFEDYPGDSLGYSVWRFMQSGIGNAFSWYRDISILLGLAITISYFIITNSKINYFQKFIFAYVGILFIAIYIYYNLHCKQFPGGIIQRNQNIFYFFIIYTSIFSIMYLLNYIFTKKITLDINKSIKNIE